MSTKKRNLLTKAGWLLFYLYIVMLCYFLFFSEHYGRNEIQSEYKSNLILLHEIKRYLHNWNRIGIERFVVNILGNIFAFSPFGFLLPLLNKRYRYFFVTASLSLLFSLAVETIQLWFRVGIFDVDDLLLNTTGGILGYIFYKIFSLIMESIKAKQLKQGAKNKKINHSAQK